MTEVDILIEDERWSEVDLDALARRAFVWSPRNSH
jgi:hypothetical protein